MRQRWSAGRVALIALLVAGLAVAVHFFGGGAMRGLAAHLHGGAR